MKKLLCVAFVIAVGLYLGYDMRQEENDCYVVTEYVDHVRCMSGGTEVCQPSDVPGTERMKKTDCPG